MNYEEASEQVQDIPEVQAKSVVKETAIETLRKIWNGGAKAIISLLAITPLIPKKWQANIAKLVQVIDVIVAEDVEVPEL